jgi:hypothetical protein
MAHQVEITQSGRGGSIYYREADQVVSFGWEFAVEPALALIFGPKASQWAGAVPWAAGRQQEIFDRVGEEVDRQKAEGCGFETDLEDGVIEILHRRQRARKAPPSEAFQRFLASAVPEWQHWAEGQTYDLAALRAIEPKERDRALSVLTARDASWREVEALAVIDTRLAAARVASERDPSFDLDSFLARQIRRLHNPAEGLARALELARLHPTPTIRQALLWASYNTTDCAPHCARLLLELTGAADPGDAAIQPMLDKLGYHNSSFDREEAFESLSRLVAMELDTSVDP